MQSYLLYGGHNMSIITQSPKSPPNQNKGVAGVIYWPSRYYRNRYECQFYGRRGIDIRNWIRDCWGDIDDMVWSTGENWAGSIQPDYTYTAMITPQQLTHLLLKWG